VVRRNLNGLDEKNGREPLVQDQVFALLCFDSIVSCWNELVGERGFELEACWRRLSRQGRNPDPELAEGEGPPGK